MRAEILLLICGMALATFFTRFASLVLFRTTGFPGWLERWLKHIPTAVLTALIVPALLLPRGELDISLNNYYLIAGLIAGFIAWRTHNIAATLTIGMAVMLILQLGFFNG